MVPATVIKLDRYTNEAYSFVPTIYNAAGGTMTDADVDNVIYCKGFDGLYYKRIVFGAIPVDIFGVKGDDSTDNIDMLSNLTSYLNTAVNVGSVDLIFPPGGIYRTSGTFTIPAGVNVNMLSTLTYTGSGFGLVIGSESVKNNRVKLYINCTSLVQSLWTDSENVGITLNNLNDSSDVYVDNVQNFTEGIRCVASNGNGFVYNNIRLGRIINCKLSFRGTTKTSGWFNENLIFGGKIQRISTVNPNIQKIGFQIDCQDGTYVNNNNNNFYKPSIEMRADTETSIINYPILIKDGRFNAFYDIRIESSNASSPLVIRTENAAERNLCFVGYANNVSSNPLLMIDDAGTAPSSYVSTRSEFLRINAPKKIIFSSGLLKNKTCNYNSTSIYAEQALYFLNSGSSSLTSFSTSITRVNDGYLTIPSTRGIGVRIDTKSFKRFVVSKSIGSSAGGRTSVRCFDSSGAVLASSTTAYVKGNQTQVMAYSANFGGCYRQGSDQTGPVYFEVTNDVAYIDIFISGGTASVDLYDFQVEGVDGFASVVSSYTLEGLYAAEKPTSTDYASGTFIRNISFVSGSPIGWMFNGTTWIDVITPMATTAIQGSVLKSVALTASAPIAVPLTSPTTAGASYSQTDTQAMLTDIGNLVTQLNATEARLADLISKQQAAGQQT